MSDNSPMLGQNPSGIQTPIQVDASGNLKINQTPIDDGYTYTNLTTNTTTTIKSGAGNLAYITINNPGSAWILTVYDNTTGSGTKIATIAAVSGLINSNIYKVKFNTGLTIVTSGTTAGDATVAWR